MFFRFHVKWNVAWTYCARTTGKRETNENEAIVLGFGATVQQKESGIGAHSGGFLQTPTHSKYIAAREYTAISSLPLKLPGIWCSRYHLCGNQ